MQNNGLRLAEGIAAAGAAVTAAIGPDYGWNYQRVQEQHSNSEDQQHTFHDCFLLVTANWTVIISWAECSTQRVLKALSVRNS